MSSSKPEPESGYEVFNLGDWALQSGDSIPSAQIAYKTYGHAGAPAVIYPSWYSGCKLFFLIIIGVVCYGI